MNYINCKILEKKGKKVEVEIEGQKVIVPQDIIPNTLSKDKTLKIIFLNSSESVITEKILAKTILEEILNGK